MSALLFIDSRSRDSLSGEAFNSFQVRPLQGLDGKGFTKVKLISCSIPLSGYTFRTGISNQFVINEGAGDKTIVIPAGNYNDTSFGTTLSGLINSTSGITGTYTCTFSLITGLLTISSTIAHTLKWPQPELAWVLGFPSTNSTSATSHTGTFCYNLSPASYIFLKVDGLPLCNTNNTCSFSYPLPTSSNSSFWLPLEMSISLDGELPNVFNVSLVRNPNELFDARTDWQVLLQFS